MLPPSPPSSDWDSPPPPGQHLHYRASPTFTFHAYSPPASPRPEDDAAPPPLPTKRPSRSSAPFPTFLYASEPPPVTARNKQRVRPSPAQLADLKALYAHTAHPTREERERLGRRIGMRYQSVTNWFQNQRSTAKKRTAAHPTRMASEEVSPERVPDHVLPDRSATTASPRRRRPVPSDLLDHDTEAHQDTVAYRDVPRRRHGVLEQRQYDLATMDQDKDRPRPRLRTDPVRDIIIAQSTARHQLVLVQQQQHTPLAPQSHSIHTTPQHSPPHTPPPHLPLPLSGAAIVPSTFGPRILSLTQVTLPPAPQPALVSSFQVSRAGTPAPAAAASVNRSVSTSASAHTAAHRGKRSRPTPHQLSALRALHAQTPSPSIEERSRVGQEIGMELGKVTNWFRNLRQTARKKERRAQEAGVLLPAGGASSRKRARGQYEDEDDTASHHSMACDSDDEDARTGMDVDDEAHRSEFGTEPDPAHEAVTPEPQHAHAPVLVPTTPGTSAPASSRGSTSPRARVTLPSTREKHASVDDAMLLLAFHGARA